MKKLLPTTLSFALLSMASSSYVMSITTASRCSTCSTWTQWMNTIEQERPWMNVEHYDFFQDYELLASLDVLPIDSLSVPTAIYVGDDNQVRLFDYGRSESWLQRWMGDVDFGFMELVPRIVPNDGFEEQHQLFMQIISKEPPEISATISSLPSVGFGWFPLTPPKNFTTDYLSNTTIVKGLLGGVTGQHELPLGDGLLHRLLPPITPYFKLDKALRTTVNEILSALATEEVHLISDNPLPSWWLSISSSHPGYGFVHRNSTESGLPSPCTLTFRRRMEFTTPTVSNKTWLAAVHAGRVAPISRPSSLPEHLDPSVTELSGDTLDDWLATHPNGVLYFYTNATQSCPAANTGSGFGRMMLPRNDHEMFLSTPVPNTAVHFSSGLPTTTTDCTAWEEKPELREEKQEL